ncbi:hypothetical protein Cabys_3239 [Caldithrix abyssi DSM 13497]|uniref:Uncharacterized protein n=1 Tax=Caldithrix abyssi DSM 13497 TaxID=880073 RepID=A0A1J1CB95_CALAY|nr:hypothetical protein Cabys_3239 [Caldithrix abyssi DSM 13497]
MQRSVGKDCALQADKTVCWLFKIPCFTRAQNKNRQWGLSQKLKFALLF